MNKFDQFFLMLLFSSGIINTDAQTPIASIKSTMDSVPEKDFRWPGYCGDSHYTSRLPRHDLPPSPLRQILTLPDVIGVYIHVVKNDDGSGPGTSMDSIVLKFEYMRETYAPHGICFLLAGIDEIHNTDLDTQYIDFEEFELMPYLKPDMLNIFIHDYLGDYPGGSSYGGNAYTIPNPYFSWWEASVADSNAISVVAHETGHCLGLFHTHETSSGAENVDRTGSCKDCDVDGDLLCDTPADPNLSTNGFMIGCGYVGNVVDNCGEQYLPDPTNIMSYAPGFCQTNFTIGQGTRMLDMMDYTQFLSDMLLPENVVFPFNLSFLFDSGEWFWLAKTFIHMESPSLVCSQSAEVTFGAGTEITVGPGTTFSPTTGFISILVQNVCE